MTDLGEHLRYQILHSLLEQGGRAYNERRLGEALRCYQEAKKVVSVPSLKHAAVWIEASLGDIQMQRGRLRESLGHFGTVVAADGSAVPPADRFYAMVRFVEVGQQIPVDLTRVHAAVAEAERFAAAHGLGEHGHEIRVFQARLQYQQGEFDTARQTAARAWLERRLINNPSGQVDDFHLDGLTTYCIATGRLDEAASHLEEWDKRPDPMPANRLVRRERCLAEYHLALNQLDHARRSIGRCLEEAAQSDYEETRAASAATAAKIALAGNDRALMERALGLLTTHRASQRIHVRFLVAVGLLAARLQCGAIEKRPVAARVAQRVDAAFGCKWRAEAIERTVRGKRCHVPTLI